MKDVLVNARLQALELARYPAATVPALALPLVSYLIFGLPAVGHDPVRARYVFISFAAFAVLGIVMFQFGVGIASDRETSWERWVRTLPVGPGARFAARLLVALSFAVLALLPLALVAQLIASPALDLLQWLRILFALLVGAVPLGLLGIALGYLLSDRAALPVTNLLYLPLAYAGGLFASSTSALPGPAATVSPWLPTRQWSDALHDYGVYGIIPWHQVIALCCYSLLFAGIAGYAYRRDEARQYS